MCWPTGDFFFIEYDLNFEFIRPHHDSACAPPTIFHLLLTRKTTARVCNVLSHIRAPNNVKRVILLNVSRTHIPVFSLCSLASSPIIQHRKKNNCYSSTQNAVISLVKSTRDVLEHECKLANPELMLVVGNYSHKLILQVYMVPTNC